MHIPTDFRKLIVDEFRLVAKRVKEEEDIRRKNFFFSGTYAIVFAIRPYDLLFITQICMRRKKHAELRGGKTNEGK
jgi:hypothetical protein